MDYSVVCFFSNYIKWTVCDVTVLGRRKKINVPIAHIYRHTNGTCLIRSVWMERRRKTCFLKCFCGLHSFKSQTETKSRYPIRNGARHTSGAPLPKRRAYPNWERASRVGPFGSSPEFVVSIRPRDSAN